MIFSHVLWAANQSEYGQLERRCFGRRLYGDLIDRGLGAKSGLQGRGKLFFGCCLSGALRGPKSRFCAGGKRAGRSPQFPPGALPRPPTPLSQSGSLSHLYTGFCSNEEHGAPDTGGLESRIRTGLRVKLPSSTTSEYARHIESFGEPRGGQPALRGVNIRSCSPGFLSSLAFEATGRPATSSPRP